LLLFRRAPLDAFGLREIVSELESELALIAADVADLQSGSTTLRFDRILPGDHSRGLAPAYHFKIRNVSGAEVGHINFRVGESRHVVMTAGHLGFAIDPEHRGSGHAFHACLALVPLMRHHYERVILTCDPENSASIRTIEKLGTYFIGEVTVPPDDPGYESGSRRKKRYMWEL